MMLLQHLSEFFLDLDLQSTVASNQFGSPDSLVHLILHCMKFLQTQAIKSHHVPRKPQVSVYSAFMNTCDMIKGNESDVGNIDSEI